MLARRFKCRNQRWEYLFKSLKHSIRSYVNDCSNTNWNYRGSVVGNNYSRGNFVRQHLLECSGAVAAGSNSLPLNRRFQTSWQGSQLRYYSSESGGRNAGDKEHISVKDGVNIDKSDAQKREVREDIQQFDQHARLGSRIRRNGLVMRS
ncbi:ATP-dependent zinc metalloprotease FtsH [Bienertia sinuspersici]